VAVVQDPAEFNGNELVPKSTNVPVEGQTLEVDMGGTKNGSSRRLVTSSGLDTDESVLNNVDTANTVFPAESIQSKEDLDTIGVSLLLLWNVNLDGKTAFEFNGDALRGLRCVLGGGSQFPHVCWRGGVGVLKDACLIGNMEQVLVGGPRLCSGLGDRDVALGCILEKSLATCKPVVELRDTPRRNDFDVGLEAVESKLKPDLIVALASAAMRDKTSIS
jgi:hypothetical protein